MTIRKRIKQRWHFRLGNFEFKKATYNPDKSRTFEVWYQHELIGICESKYYSFARHNLTGVVYSELPKFLLNIKDLGCLKIVLQLNQDPIGRVFFRGTRNQFPAEILYVDLFHAKLKGNMQMLSQRKTIIEKIEPK